MKKIRIMMTMAAFAIAMVAAVASSAVTPTPDVFVFTSEGLCVEVATQLPSGCSSFGGSQTCLVNTEEYGNTTAYSIQYDPYTCIGAYMRW